MIVDSHQHVFWYGRDDAGLVADLDEHGIDLAWLLSWDVGVDEDAPSYHPVLNPRHRRPDGTHPGIPLDDLLLARDHYPDRFIVGYCPHPLRGDAPGLFESAYHMHRVRVCGEWKFRVLFDDPRCLRLFQKAGELGCPVVLHLDVPFLPDGSSGEPVYQPSWYGGTIDNLDRAAKACPDTVFIGHAPGFWRHISGGADGDSDPYPAGPVAPGGRLYDLFATLPNLYADLSAGSGLGALQRDTDHGRRFLQQFADRLLFGRDFYGDKLHRFLKEIDLPAQVIEKIYVGNASRLVPDLTHPLPPH